MDKKKLLKQEYNKAFNLAVEIVEEIGRDILKNHSSLNEFVMGMGTWCFWDNKGHPNDDTDLKYLKRMADFMDEWDEYLHLTGYPMRFTATGEVQTDW